MQQPPIGERELEAHHGRSQERRVGGDERRNLPLAPLGMCGKRRRRVRAVQLGCRGLAARDDERKVDDQLVHLLEALLEARHQVAQRRRGREVGVARLAR